MSKIKMDPVEMSSKASQLDKQGDEFGKAIKQIDRLVTQLCGAWDGQASDAFSAQFKQLKPSLQKTEQLIHDLSKQVKDISKIMSDADTEIAKKLK